MFYSHSLLSKRGPLGNIWVAAYFYKKLKKEQVAETDISSVIDEIIPDIRLSYRVLAHLLLGVVRIFSKKVDYLFHDCNQSLIRLAKMFLTSPQNRSKEATGSHHHKVSSPKEATHGQHHCVSLHKAVDAPIEAVRAAYHDNAITLPKSFQLDSFDLEIPEEDENVSTHERFRLQVEDEFNEPLFMNQRQSDEMIALSDFCSGCFTPVEDVISFRALDIDLDIGKAQQAGGSEVKQSLQGDFQALEECGNRSNARRSLNLSINTQELEEQAVQKELQQAKLSDLSHAPLEGYAEIRTPVHEHSKMNMSCASEVASPEFAVTTPAIKERHRMSRKRKCLFDETIVLPNQILRQWIHDGNSLICKRRKAPHTFLDAWKAQKMSNIEGSLMEPLIPCLPCDFYELFLDSSFVSATEKESADPTHKPDFEKTDALTEREQRDHLPGKSSVVLPSMSCADVSTAGRVDEEIFEEPLVFDKSGSEITLIDRDFSSSDGERNSQDGWSIRTRLVAQYLFRCFERGKGALNLSKILEGKRRTECTKVFYEMLVLKNCRYVDVEQESAFGDIIVSTTAAMRTMFQNDRHLVIVECLHKSQH